MREGVPISFFAAQIIRVRLPHRPFIHEVNNRYIFPTLPSYDEGVSPKMSLNTVVRLNLRLYVRYSCRYSLG